MRGTGAALAAHPHRPSGVCRNMPKVLALKPWITALALAGAAGALGACGVKGALEPPPGAQAEGQARSAESGDAGDKSAAKAKPHENFILDPLLR
jgi:predicted small lipoprotein YifL